MIPDMQGKVGFHYTIYNKQSLVETDKPVSFLVQDMLDLIEPNMSVVEINYIFVSPDLRRLGIAGNLIKKLQHRFAEDLIVVAAGAIKEEYSEEPVAEQYEDLLSNLDKFYTSLGFVSINTFVGYEDKIAYVWDNGRAMRVLAKECEAVALEIQHRHLLKLDAFGD